MQSDDPLLTFGNEMYGWATDLFPINRSLTGEGTLETLDYLKDLLPNLEIKSIAYILAMYINSSTMDCVFSDQ